ncbi:MAG: ABC transporter permease [Pirellulales bacterium]
MNKKSSLLSILTSGSIGPFIALLVIILFFGICDKAFGSGEFISLKNSRQIANSAAMIAIPALGMTMIIIAGGIDLSAGTALTLCGTVLVTMLNKQEPAAGEPGFALAVALAIGVCLLSGLLCGSANGLLITSTQVVPFIVTLGTMSIFLGTAQIIAKESTVQADLTHLPEWLDKLCYTGSNGSRYSLVPFVPTSVLVTVVLAIIVDVVLRFTVFGRNLFAIGSNRSTARLCGVPIFSTVWSLYAIAGLLFAIGGVLYIGNVKNGNPKDGVGMELLVIAAVVLGGGSLSGGRGSVLGTIIGAIIIFVIRSGCTQLQISNTYTHIIIGAIIIIAVIVDQLRNGMPEWLFRMVRNNSA